MLQFNVKIDSNNVITAFMFGSTPSDPSEWTIITHDKMIEVGMKYVNGVVDESPSLWRQIREVRNQLLQSSDWTQMPDVVQHVLSAEQLQLWVDYRQTLRDITTAFEDPTQVVWPEKPE